MIKLGEEDPELQSEVPKVIHIDRYKLYNMTNNPRQYPGRDVSAVSAHYFVRNALKACKKCAECAQILKRSWKFKLSVYLQRISYIISAHFEHISCINFSTFFQRISYKFFKINFIYCIYESIILKQSQPAL